MPLHAIQGMSPGCQTCCQLPVMISNTGNGIHLAKLLDSCHCSSQPAQYSSKRSDEGPLYQWLSQCFCSMQQQSKSPWKQECSALTAVEATTTLSRPHLELFLAPVYFLLRCRKLRLQFDCLLVLCGKGSGAVRSKQTAEYDDKLRLDRCCVDRKIRRASLADEDC